MTHSYIVYIRSRSGLPDRPPGVGQHRLDVSIARAGGVGRVRGGRAGGSGGRRRAVGSGLTVLNLLHHTTGS